MNQVSVALGEVVRVGTWSLRALGYRYGTADRAARLLAYTEGTVGGALRMVRLGEETMLATGPAARQPRAVGGREIDAAGKHLLEVGPPALDLACADARTGGKGAVRVTRAIGTKVVPALCDLVQRRGLAVLAVHGASFDVPADLFGGAGWLAVWPAADGPVFVESGSLAGTPFAGEALDAAPGELRITVVTVDEAWPQPASRADYPERLARAYREGVMVEPADIQQLYEIEKRTWAPSSERSRKQAGF